MRGRRAITFSAQRRPPIGCRIIGSRNWAAGNGLRATGNLDGAPGGWRWARSAATDPDLTPRGNDRRSAVFYLREQELGIPELHKIWRNRMHYLGRVAGVAALALSTTALSGCYMPPPPPPAAAVAPGQTLPPPPVIGLRRPTRCRLTRSQPIRRSRTRRRRR